MGEIMNINLQGNKLRMFYALIISVVVLALLPFAPNLYSTILILYLYFVFLAMMEMWNLVAGYSGLVSLGPQAMIGLAAYTLGGLSLRAIPIPLGILAGGAVGAIMGLVMGLLSQRMKGLYFAIGTLMIPMALSVFFDNYKPPGAPTNEWGGAGVTIPGASLYTLNDLYYFALIVGLASIIIVYLIMNSRVGLALIAMGDNEVAASTVGINIYRSKIYIMMLSGFMTGIAGGVYYLFTGYVYPFDAFSISWLMLIIVGTVIGGIGT
ncbi:MAG: branched-chain amino acid ABC transporter permease, partial [Conexivisphaera sp.]